MGEKISFIDLFGTELELEDEYAREMLADESAARTEDVAVLEARMDTFTALPDGSTAGDAELTDIRVGADGVTYPNAGDAVRGQISEQKKSIDTKAVNSHYFDLEWVENHTILADGHYYALNGVSATERYYPVKQGDIIRVFMHAPGQSDNIVLYDTNKNFVEYFRVSRVSNVYDYTVPQDGYMRFSNEPDVIPNANTYAKITNSAYMSIEEIESAIDATNDNLSAEINDVNGKFLNVPYEFVFTWDNGHYVNEFTGNLGNSASYSCTGFTVVLPGQKLDLYLSASGVNECAVAFYTDEKVFISSKKASGEKTVTVPENAYFARFTTNNNLISTANAYVKNHVEQGTVDSTLTKPYFPSAFDEFAAGEATVNYEPSTLPLDYTYKGEVNPEKRYMAIGFDDFRASDFDMVVPLFDKYGAKAVFNRVASSDEMSTADKVKINNVIYGGHELGDHTWLHYNYPYTLPLFNGQNPASPEGTQEPYPTNAQMTSDRGDGKNALGRTLTDSANIGGVSTAWGSLTAAECQTIREYYAVIKDTTLCTVLDTLSNKYLGTTGSSAGSWDSTTNKYTGGIFTGCATSCNHEIWERILMVTRMYYKDQFGLNYTFNTWSWPGSKGENISFEQDGLRYYDAEHTKLINYLARFESSLYTDELGNPKNRSWNDVLAEFGYTDTHDSIYPNRYDGQPAPEMRWQYIYNADLSRPNAIIYPTNRVVSYSAISTGYPESFFTSGKTKAAQMYDADEQGQFHRFIEIWRERTSQGIIGGEVIDSVDNYSERVFLEEMLRYCKETGVEVITKAQAYDICFNHRMTDGNLMYNPRLRNTAKEFLKDATTVPDNPDGYSTNCETYKDENNVNVLRTTATTYHEHYGIPIGRFKFSADVKTNGGSKSVTIKAIKNSDNYTLSYNDIDNLDTLASISIPASATDFTEYTAEFVVKENDLTAYEQKCAGYGDKITGILFIFTGGMDVKNMRLEEI